MLYSNKYIQNQMKLNKQISLCLNQQQSLKYKFKQHSGIVKKDCAASPFFVAK